MHIDHHHLVAIAIFTEATVAQLPSAPPRQPSRTMTESKIVQDMDKKAKTGKFAVKQATDKKAHLPGSGMEQARAQSAS